MEPVTESLTDEHIALLEELSGDDGPCKNRSEAMRFIIDQYNETKDLQRENDRLREQLAATNRRVDQHQELVEYVQDERSVAQKRERRREAPAWRRAKWWLLGEPAEEK